MRVRCLLFLLFYLLSIEIEVAAQNNNPGLSGILLDHEYEPVAGAVLSIEGIGSVTSDEQGKFSFLHINSGRLVLKTSHTGFETTIDTLIKNADQNLFVELRLFPLSNELNGITVMGKSENQKVREQAIRTVVIDTRAASAQAITITDLMNRSTGVRIRQNGGLGSQPELSVNGFQGKAIKYFKDGIPLDYQGEGYNIASLPLEVLERVEIYKGVLPVHLGADALGGAVNLVPKEIRKHRLNTFYEYGSFNTHRAGLSGAYRTRNNKWVMGGDLFFNYSENNYKATVNVINPVTRNPEPTRLPLFHNAYKNYYGEVFTAVQNVSWADELKLSISGFNLSRAVQHPALMTDAYGALQMRQNTIAPTLRYKKSTANQKLQLDQFAAYNELQTQRIDTLRGSYDWYGNFTPKAAAGESRLPSFSTINERQIVLRSNILYRINEQTGLNLNYVFTHAKRKATDPYGAKLNDTSIDLLSISSVYQKHVFGLSLKNSWLNDQLQNELIGKQYLYRASGLQNTWNALTITDTTRTQQKGTYWGIADAIKYQINPASFLRASAEYAYRLPEREELFGNNVFIVPNFELNPERSWNLNLGYRLEPNQKFTLEANSFYRNTQDLILLVPIQAPNAQYRNQEKVRGFGFDLDMAYQLTKHYKINANASWQDLRLFGITNAQDTWKNHARLRNTPYFFANAGINADYENIFNRKDQLKLYINYNYLREFYLETIPKNLEAGGFLGLSGSANLNTSLLIPDQHILNFGFTYQFSSEKISIGAELRNITNTDVFDYYRVQKPGRNASIKLSYYL